MAITKSPAQAKGGVQSVELGMLLLKNLSSLGGKTTLNELAEQVKMHPAKVHRYLVSLVNTGFVKRTSHGHYDLGPYVLEFATSYLSRLDPTTIADRTIEELWSDTGEGIILCVWGDAGPTVIRWIQARRPISIVIRPGSVFSLTMSAAGRTFLANLPEKQTRSMLLTELEQFEKEQRPLAPRTMEDIDSIVRETREHGLARVMGHSIESLSALSAPVFDYRGDLVLAVVLFGFKEHFDVSWNSSNAQKLRLAANEVSQKLGFADSEETHLDKRNSFNSI